MKECRETCSPVESKKKQVLRKELHAMLTDVNQSTMSVKPPALFQFFEMTELPEAAAPSGRKFQKWCHKHLKDTCTDPSCECWHFSRVPKVPKRRKACSYGDKCSFLSCRVEPTHQTRNRRRMGRQERALLPWCGTFKSWVAYLRMFIPCLFVQ